MALIRNIEQWSGPNITDGKIQIDMPLDPAHPTSSDQHKSYWINLTNWIQASNVQSFTDLTDTPSSYALSQFKLVRVNSNEDGLEFINPKAISGRWHVPGATDIVANTLVLECANEQCAKFEVNGTVTDNFYVILSDTLGGTKFIHFSFNFQYSGNQDAIITFANAEVKYHSINPLINYNESNHQLLINPSISGLINVYLEYSESLSSWMMTVFAENSLNSQSNNFQVINTTTSLTHDCDTYNGTKITGQASSLNILAPIGTKTDMMEYTLCIKDDGTSRLINWDTSFVPLIGSLPSETVASTQMIIYFVYNLISSKWTMVGYMAGVGSWDESEFEGTPNTLTGFNSLGEPEEKTILSAWQSTPDNNHIPGEKLVKDNIDNISGYEATETASGTTTLTVNSKHTQLFWGTNTQTVIMPTVSSLTLGREFSLINDSTKNVTIQSSGTNEIMVLRQGYRVVLKCTSLSGTGVSSWTIIGMTEAIVLVCSDIDTNITSGTKVKTSFNFNFRALSFYAYVNTAPTGLPIIIDVNNGINSMLSTKLYIDVSENNSLTASIAYVIDTNYQDYIAGGGYSVDLDQHGSTVPGKGLIVIMDVMKK